MNVKCFFAFTLALLVSYCLQCTESVFESDPFWCRFSTKTKYDWVQTNAEGAEENEWFQTQDGCQAVHVSIVARHGTRNPSNSQVDDVANIYSRMKNKTFEWNRERFPTNEEKELVESGRKELKDLGNRTATRLSALFPESLQPGVVQLWSSEKQRARDSTEAFLAGFTTRRVFSPGPPDISVSDLQLRYHKHCKEYVEMVKNGPDVFAEYLKFMSKGQEMASVVQHLTTQLGVSVSNDEAVSLYYMCAFETAIFGNSSWCQFLNPDLLQVLEYLNDLEDFYGMGPVYPITWKQSCILLTPIFSEMDKAIAANQTQRSYVRGRFAFGHSGGMGPLLSALGIFDDQQPLTADNFQKEQNRTFRTSLFLPFAANVQLVLYKCASDFRLKLFINEEEFRFPIPQCQLGGCPFDTVKAALAQKGLLDCDKNRYDELCNNTAQSDDLDTSNRSCVSLSVSAIRFVVLVQLICFLYVSF